MFEGPLARGGSLPTEDEQAGGPAPSWIASNRKAALLRSSIVENEIVAVGKVITRTTPIPVADLVKARMIHRSVGASRRYACGSIRGAAMAM